MSTKDVVKRILRWSELFKNNKYPPLGNEAAEGPRSKFTNFSLQHIMEKYNFLPSLMLKREFLLSLGAKNPELVKDAFFPEKYKYHVKTDAHPPENPEPAQEPESHKTH